MPIGACELYMEIVIREELALLRSKPWRLEYLLNAYCAVPSVMKRVGPDFISQAMDLVMNTELTVQPYYTPNVDQYPCLIMQAGYDESETYIGDIGEMTTGDELAVDDHPEIQPVTYATFDVSEVSGNSVFVSEQYNIAPKIFRNLWISNGKQHAKIIQILPIPGKPTQLVCDRTFPTTGVALANWKAGTPLTPKNVFIHGSHDNVQVTMQLKTSGNFEVHRIWSQVIYQCLKRGRQRLDDYGMQLFKFARTAPTCEDQQGMIFSTNLSASGVQLDTWVSKETDPLYRINLKVEAVGTQPGEGDVDL